MSFVLLGILNSQAAGGAFNYWLANLDSVNSDAADAIDVDASGNIVLSGNSSVNFATQLSPDLSINWQIGLDTGFANTHQAVDSSGNLYMVYQTNQVSRSPGIAKFNSSGVLQWQRIIGGNLTDMPSITLDNNEEPVLSWRDFSGARYMLVITTYDAAGNAGNLRTIDLGQDVFTGGIGVLSNDEFNVHVAANPSRETTIVHTDTTLGLARTEKLNNSGAIPNNLLVAQLPSGNFTYTMHDEQIQAWTFSFTLSWQKSLTYAGIDIRNGAYDSQEYIYFVGYGDKTVGSGDDGLIFKFDNNGNLQWQRKLGFTSHSTRLNDIYIDANDDIYVSGFSDYNSSAFVAKLPSDGSLTGTYELDGQEIIYEASTASDSNTSFSVTGISASEVANFSTPATGTSSTTTPTLAIESIGIG